MKKKLIVKIFWAVVTVMVIVSMVGFSFAFGF